jgi:hypothetical protein
VEGNWDGSHRPRVIVQAGHAPASHFEVLKIQKIQKLEKLHFATFARIPHKEVDGLE